MKRSILIYSLGLMLTALSCNHQTENETTETIKQEPEMKMKNSTQPKLRHAVFFKFKESATEDNIDAIQEAFSALPGKIPQIKGYEWGTNNSPEGHDKGFTHCFFLTFDDEEGRAAYLPHPDHKAFGELLGPYLEDAFVFDYWTHEE